MSKKKVKQKLNKKGIIVLILTLYLLIMAFYYVFSLPVKNILVTGNKTLRDEDIISASGITLNSKIFLLNKNKISKNIESLSTIKNVKIKRNITGKLKIVVEEQDILFYNVLSSSYVLSDGTEVSSVKNNIGIPTLINYVPKDIYISLLKKIQNIDLDTFYLISEIEYQPDIKNNVTIDANRFLFRMNDGNYVYINLANFNNLNKYEEIYATLDDGVKGVLNLDSNSKGILFQSFESLNKVGE